MGGNKPSSAIEPIYTYRHTSSQQGGFSVTGGFVYRGSIKSLQGTYVFADYVLPRIWFLNGTKGKLKNQLKNLSKEPINLITSLSLIHI